jgi:peptide deformylase
MLVTYKDPTASILSSKTVPVTSGDEAVSLIIALEKELEHSRSGIGLAANQINIPKSVAIIRHGSVFINLINPTILSATREFVSHDEGCLSFPSKRFDVPRFGTVRIRNHILWPTQVGSIAIEDDPNKKLIDRVNPPKGLYLVPIESVYVLENDAEACGGIICVAVQHEEEHLRGITVASKPGVIERSIAGTVSIGRNDPCVCGSGKKYKKCCMSKFES